MMGLGIAAALTALPAPATVPTPIADADPAIWVLGDVDTTIYLFGTFHALDGKAQWFNDEVKTAFVASDELVLETLIPEKAAPAPLPSFQSVASSPIKPGASFLASTRVALSAGRAKGLTYAKGADAVLRAAARDAGKRVSGIESFEFQLAMFSRIPPAPVQPLKAGESVDAADHLSKVMGEMQAAWNRGDGEIFATMLDGMRTNSPETYRVLFVERNERWAQWIAGRLQRPGTVFIAVGAGHLAGADSLQNNLAKRGIASARIN